AGGPVPAPITKEKVIAIMGGFAPHAPQDLSLFSSRVDGFALEVLSDCRTMERLDRRIGQRRDATRAPTQARSGWRPSGRLLISPAPPSMDGRNFVQTMGSTSDCVHNRSIPVCGFRASVSPTSPRCYSFRRFR